MKELKDYLPLYIGQKVWTRHDALNNGDFQALTVSINNLFEMLYKYKDSKLILRELSDMTEEEQRELGRIALPECEDAITNILHTQAVESKGRSKDGRIIMDNYTPEMVAWLLSKGFDLFGLIPAGLAVDNKTLNP